MTDPLDTIAWSGNDREFDIMVAATERAPTFDMSCPGRGIDRLHACTTAGCLYGNYMAASGTGPPVEFSYTSAAIKLGIAAGESVWLFAACQYSPSECIARLRFRARAKPYDKEPNLARLKKYLAWKRRKAERIEIDELIQECDRQLIRRQQSEKRQVKQEAMA